MPQSSPARLEGRAVGSPSRGCLDSNPVRLTDGPAPPVSDGLGAGFMNDMKWETATRQKRHVTGGALILMEDCGGCPHHGGETVELFARLSCGQRPAGRCGENGAWFGTTGPDR